MRTSKKNSISPLKTFAYALSLFICPLTVAHAQIVQPPSILKTARTAFLANAGEEDNQLCRQAYEIFTQDLKKSGRFQLVESPSAADLILELHYTASPNVVQIFHGDGGSGYVFRFRVIVIDRETHTALWSLSEFIKTPDKNKSFEQSFNEALGRLTTDIEALHDGRSSSATSATSGKNN